MPYNPLFDRSYTSIGDIVTTVQNDDPSKVRFTFAHNYCRVRSPWVQTAKNRPEISDLGLFLFGVHAQVNTIISVKRIAVLKQY